MEKSVVKKSAVQKVTRFMVFTMLLLVLICLLHDYLDFPLNDDFANDLATILPIFLSFWAFLDFYSRRRNDK
ncbi:DUF4044 domain-containing protein [Fructobacillus papyrifericola]|uniref:DUF4044 domain-containing protein n=1 Tax=Fructobacillus papyrifericola TaxID=2713172 RepID=A0ABS5QW69_9LACO|nr:DUF4044 domain-containing protein [Fructobacillus papyrifericola]MBS9336800.1 DUF4044 domain-containing protein [Fructobacillus papyrifericola]